MRRPVLIVYTLAYCLIAVAGIQDRLDAASTAQATAEADLTDVDQIMLNVENRDNGDNMVYTFVMTLIDRHGSRRHRKVKSFFKDFGEDRYGIIFFMEPANLHKTAFLTFDYDDSQKEDDQWIYLPAMKKTSRIGSADKTASFVGSDITFADLTERKAADYHHRMIKPNAVLRGHETWMIEQIPKEQQEIDKFGYIKALHFVEKKSYFVIRSIFWLKGNHRLKYYDMYDFKKIDGIWTELSFSFTTTSIDGHVIHRTEGHMQDVSYFQDLDPSYFTVSQLEAGMPPQ
jgi:hypothetical protein